MGDEFEDNLRSISNELEELRIEFFKKCVDEEKGSYDDALFKLQSDVRTIAEEISLLNFEY